MISCDIAYIGKITKTQKHLFSSKFQIHPMNRQYEKSHRPSGNEYIIHSGISFMFGLMEFVKPISPMQSNKLNIKRLVGRNNMYIIAPLKKVKDAKMTVFVFLLLMDSVIIYQTICLRTK